jgi:DNA-binding transcriptional ArsR family regulator
MKKARSQIQSGKLTTHETFIQEHCASCFAGLSCQPRISIIRLLQKNKEMSVTQIAKHFSVTQPTISHHLKYLKTVGILSSKKQGRKVFYQLSPKCGKNLCVLFN